MQLSPKAPQEELISLATAYEKARQFYLNKPEKTDQSNMITTEVPVEDPIMMRLKTMELQIKSLQTESS